MKRFLSLIVLLLYFVSSTGATMNFHLCMGEVTKVSLQQHNDEICDKCGMEKVKSTDSGCCKDEQKWIKIEDAQKLSSVLFGVPKLSLEPSGYTYLFAELTPISIAPVFRQSIAPLRSCEVARYLQICVFRI